jgi:hypothetical protein
MPDLSRLQGEKPMPRPPAAAAGLLFAALLASTVARTEAMLEVAGRIRDGPVTLDVPALAAFGTTLLVTDTPWTDGESRFEGVLLRDLLAGVGARGTRVRAEALNDYAATIPVEEAETTDVLVAWARDGRPLPRRDKGPFWIVYPWSDRPELDDRLHRQRAVWQLRRLVVE